MKKRPCFLLLLLIVATAGYAQDTTQKQYVGKYKFPDGSVVPEVEVSIENGVLMMTSSAGTSPLELLRPDSFNITSFSGVAVFKRNETKKVIGVHIEAGGYVLDGTKDSITSGKTAFRFLKQVPAGMGSMLGAGDEYLVYQQHQRLDKGWAPLRFRWSLY